MTEARVIKIGSGVVRYRVEGTGEPLVLIHGLGGSTDWWVRNTGPLSRHFTVYSVDLPGFGAMRRCPTPFSVRGAVAWLRSFLNALKLDKVSFIGHSMGGLIAAIFTAEYPAQVARVVLAAPAIGLPTSSIAAYLWPITREMVRVERSFWKTLIWDGMRAGFPTTLRASRDLLRSKIDDELSRIETPCLLIWGERDPIVPPTLGCEIQAKIRSSRLCLLKGAGHVLMYDRAEPFNTAVVEFLTGEADVHSHRERGSVVEGTGN